jgi:long-chain fatty acid transport protein
MESNQMQAAGSRRRANHLPGRAAMFLVLAAAGTAHATNGYFSHGYGVKSQSMGGAGIAFPQDAMAAATNPAGMALMGDRLDVGINWARRDARTRLESSFGPYAGEYDGNDTQNFFIPEFGFNRMLRPHLALGVSVYANGGMNTDYGDLNSKTAGIGVPSGLPAENGIFGTGPAGVDFSQVFVAPTFARRFDHVHAVGVSLLFARQVLAVEGVQNFDNSVASESPGNVTNNGDQASNGWGLRLGWMSRVTSFITLGATYQPRIHMDKLDKYKGLLAEQGSVDIPANYGVGIAVMATPKLIAALDVQRIKFSDVAAFGNSGNAPAQLGSDNGPGFGWRDQTVFKLGVRYQYDRSLTLRAGLNHARHPVPSGETALNMLAPVTVENHATVGVTWAKNGSELSLGYTHGFKKTLDGTGAGAGRNISLEGDILSIAYGWKL